MRPRRRELLAMVLAALTAAPTPGDVGGCGSGPVELDQERFTAERKQLDCERCGECGLDSERCFRACDPATPGDVTLPPTCRPLEHDARVCLRALRAASCWSFARYVDDRAPSTPGECVFCRNGLDGGSGGPAP